MRIVAVLCVFVVILSIHGGGHGFEIKTLDYSFDQYLGDFGKQYHGSEYEARKLTFTENLAKIVRQNLDATATWRAGVNKFTDMTAEELKQYTGYNAAMASARRQQLSGSAHRGPDIHTPLESLPTSVDWRNKGIITPVKDQGGCGSCWAFGATESIESRVMQDTGKLLTLSPQNVVSCTPNPQHCGGTGGCGGATAELAFDYVDQHGIATEKDYPYSGTTGTCNTSVHKTAKIQNYIKLIENNYTDVMVNLANVGPLAVNVDASSWFAYSSGVFTSCSFSEVDIDHVVQLVGYGSTSSLDYWIVRNSWGGSWGEKGYIRLQRHSDGDQSKWCGPDDTPQDGTGCDGGPSQVTVCGSCGIWYDTSYPTGGSVIGDLH